MKKLLFLCSRSPYPLVGGDKIRMFNSLKMLSEQYCVDLLFINDKPISSSTKEVLSKYCNEIYPFVVTKTSHIFKTFIGLFSNTKPLQVNYYYDKKIQNWVDRNINNYDAVYCNHIRTTEYVRNHSIIKIVDFVDSIAMNYEKACKTSSGFWKIIYKIEKNRVKSYEKEIAREFDKRIIISDVDKSYIEENEHFSIKVVGNFVAEILFDKNIQRRKNQICFLGKMDYEPNVSAVCYFVNKLFPQLKRLFPDLIFKVIGSQPLKKIRKLNDIEGIEVTGFVDNPYNVIHESQLFIAPMVSGAGIQNKILEAMKMGKAVITTSIGAEGLNKLTGREIIVCNSDEELINNIIDLLLNEEKSNLLGKQAKAYIEKYYSKTIITKIFLDYLESKEAINI